MGSTNLKSISTIDLKKALSDLLDITAKNLVFLGRVWVELEDRGEDLSALRSGIAIYLPLIANGKLSANAVVAFAGQQLLLRELALLPVDQQDQLAAGDKIPLVLASNDTYRVVDTTASMLHSRYYGLVFDNGRIRSPDEQKSILSKPKKTAKNKFIRKRKVIIDKDSGTLKIGETIVRLDDILAALKENNICY